jgi:L-2,4-diaminobutyric acid acetyltransferase
MQSQPTSPTSLGAESPEFDLVPPEPHDAAAIWRLVQSTPALDDNSPYAYLLLCSHFAATSLVAHAEDGPDGATLAGFVLGYIRPDRRDCAFVWQIAVAETARGRGLGGRMLDAWFTRCTRSPTVPSPGSAPPMSAVHSLGATLTRSNAASRALFSSFAKRHGAVLRENVAFPQNLFPDELDHEEEVEISIGPVHLEQARTPRHVRS